MFLAAAAVVCQQGVWRADRHRATVSQSLVHSPGLPQLWPIFCGVTRHDKGKGLVYIFIFWSNYFVKFTMKLLTGTLLLLGVLWHLACVDGRAATLQWTCNSRWQGALFSLTFPMFSSLTYSLKVSILVRLWSLLLIYLIYPVGSNFLQSYWLHTPWKRRHQSNTVSTSTTFSFLCLSISTTNCCANGQQWSWSVMLLL